MDVSRVIGKASSSDDDSLDDRPNQSTIGFVMPQGAASIKLTPESRVKLAQLKHANALPPLRKRMREATNGLVNDVRTAVRNAPSSRKRVGSKAGSLRSAVAMSFQRKIKLSPNKATVVIATVPRGGKSNLATVFDGQKPWTHPTFGHEPTVTQEGYEYFYETIDKKAPEVEAKMILVLRDFELELL